MTTPSPAIRFTLTAFAIAFFAFALATPLIRYVRYHYFYPKKVVAVETYSIKGEAKSSIDHTAFDTLLKKHVVKGRVDYANFKKDQDALRGYLKSLETIDSTTCTRDDLLALFVNAYNAATLELILEHYPGIASIKDIPAAQRWDDKRWTICGEKVSLTDLEHEILRKRFDEPRIHFAINCASIGCPPLRSEAFVGEKIDAQLQDQAVAMNRDFGGAHWDGTKLTLSKIYDWFEDDFKRKMELKNFVAQFMAPEAALEVKKRTKVDIVFQDYNWSLNDINK